MVQVVKGIANATQGIFPPPYTISLASPNHGARGRIEAVVANTAFLLELTLPIIA